MAIDGALLREGKGQKGSGFFGAFLGGRMKTLDDDDDDDDDDDGCHRFLNSFSKKKETLTSSLQPKKNLPPKEDANRHELTKVKKSTGLGSETTLGIGASLGL